jgi:hypothetical protein
MSEEASPALADGVDLLLDDARTTVAGGATRRGG